MRPVNRTTGARIGDETIHGREGEGVRDRQTDRQRSRETGRHIDTGRNRRADKWK